MDILLADCSLFVSFLSCLRYGMGMVYYKQEKYKLAEIHFSRALSINRSNAVLCCHIGIVSNPRHTWHAAFHMLTHSLVRVSRFSRLEDVTRRLCPL